MKLFVLALVAALLPAQIRQPAANIRFGSALPATCTANIGQVFFLTSASAGANLYGCTATNTWTAQGSGVGGASNLTTAGAVPYVSAAGVLNQDASNFFWDATNHRLGIGTNSPSVALQVNGGGYVKALTPDGNSDIFIGAPTNGQGWIGSLANNPVVFYSNSTIRGRIAAAGSWGIGTLNTAPTGTLHVYDATASTGATTLTVKAGAGQSSTDLMQWQDNSGTVLAAISSAGLYRQPLTTPASAAATCTAGTIVADTGFVYVCTATNTWKRVAIATW